MSQFLIGEPSIHPGISHVMKVQSRGTHSTSGLTICGRRTAMPVMVSVKALDFAQVIEKVASWPDCDGPGCVIHPPPLCDHCLKVLKSRYVSSFPRDVRRVGPDPILERWGEW